VRVEVAHLVSAQLTEGSAERRLADVAHGLLAGLGGIAVVEEGGEEVVGIGVHVGHSGQGGNRLASDIRHRR